MHLRCLFLSLLLLVPACAAVVPAPQPAPSSGIYGQVTVGPTCPVEQLKDPCPDRPYQAVLQVLTPEGRTVQQVRTDGSGNFRLGLAPGSYILHPESPSVMPRAADVAFTVTAGQFRRIDVVYDSGIR